MSDTDLSVKFGAQTDELRAGVAEALGQVHEFADGINELKSSIGEFGEALAAAFAVEKVGEFAEGMARLGFETEKAAEILGTTPQKIAALNLMAQSAGLSNEALSMSFSRLSRNVIDQSPNAKRALDALGLSFNSLAGKDGTQQFATIAEKMAGIADGSTKAAIATELFGRAGINLIPILNEGKEGAEEFAQMAERAGIVLSDQMLAAMHQTHLELIRRDA